jgi:heptosyltransferase III
MLPFRYWLDRHIRGFVMFAMRCITPRSADRSVDFQQEKIERILLMRGIFRMGDSILATPAIIIFRKRFATAKIDFVGPRVSKILFQNLPMDHHYEVFPGFPKLPLSCIALLRQIRSKKYDLAVDVSGSSAALGALIVGFSKARFRIGLKGRWDSWFNVRLPRPPVINKYQNLQKLFKSMGLETENVLPSLILSLKEKEQGRMRIEKLLGLSRGPVVGIFVGGRERLSKRWPKENFLELSRGLYARAARVILFAGPEERELIGYFEQALQLRIPVVFEPNPRGFATMVANLDLFVACDSGPVHLACALRVRTIAIFLKDNFDRWGPPPCLARVVYRDPVVSVREVLDECLLELNGSHF